MDVPNTSTTFTNIALQALVLRDTKCDPVRRYSCLICTIPHNVITFKINFYFFLNNLNGADLMSEGIIFKILETPLMVLLLNALLFGNTFTHIMLVLFLTFGGRKYWQTAGGVLVVREALNIKKY